MDQDAAEHLDLAQAADLPTDTSPEWGTPWQCDVTDVQLSFDLAGDSGEATVKLASTCNGAVSLAVKGLLDVKVDGLVHRLESGRLDIVGVPDGGAAIAWRFQRHDSFSGFTKRGSTVLWPEFCSNLYPCHPSMTDGARFTLSVTGLKAGEKAVFPALIAQDAPAYMPAFAVGDYTYHKLGVTKAGTEVGYWTLPSTAEAASKGLSDLPKVFQWFEETLGPYSYGKKVAGVAVDWGLQYGGLENHPYWHVSKLAMGDVTVHAHEAAHGWFGSGVRLSCWHDLVMSEGTADYLAAEAIEAVQGKEAAEKMWKAYQAHVDQKVKVGQDMVVWPAGCGDVDSAKDLLKQLLYKKGALFWRSVAEKIGKKALLKALGQFYVEHRNKAAKLSDLLKYIEGLYGPLTPHVDKWLTTKS